MNTAFRGWFTGLFLVLSALAGGPAAAQTFLQVKTDQGEKPVGIEKMSVKASIKGLHALVETEFVFNNPNGRVMEGELEFPLPDGAAVSGYALDVNGRMTDGVMVPKEKARVVFETEARRGVDPGIVEHVKGNLYRTRIYPLPARGTRTVRISYTTPLAIAPDGDAALRLIMPKEPVGKRTVSIEVTTGTGAVPVLGGLGDRRFERAESIWRVTAEETGVTPGEDVLVALPELPDAFVLTEKGQDGTVWFMASARPPAGVRQVPGAAVLDVFWDASTSHDGPGLALDFAFLDRLPRGASYNLVVFRDVPEKVVRLDSLDALINALKKVRYDGGTSFAFLAGRKQSSGVPAMIFTDGIDTLGDKAPANLPTAIVSSAVADVEALRQASGGAVIDLRTMSADKAAGLFFNPPARVSGIGGSGVAEVQGIGRDPIGRACVIGRLTTPTADIAIEFSGLASQILRASASSAGKGDTLARAWAAMRVAQLAPRADDFADELLAIGRKYGVVSPATTLIVLESLDQWVRYEIEPPATLPDLRNEWRAAMKGRTTDEGEAKKQHLESLETEWKERLAWLKRDFKKDPHREDVKEGVMEGGASGVVNIGMMGTGVGGGGTGGYGRIHGLGNVDTDDSARPPAPAESRRESTAQADSAYEEADEMSGARGSAAKKADSDKDADSASSIEIKPWDPATPYMEEIRKVSADRQYDTYLAQKAQFGSSPSFYLDAADHFFRAGQAGTGTTILTNLAELKIEDAALLRVLAWRLRQEKQYEPAVVQFRRIVRLRGEDPQSWRDLAVTLSEWGKASHSAERLEEALDLFAKVAFTPWQRHADTIGIFALEELNALISWIDAAKWKPGERPNVPDVEKKFLASLSTDLRIYIAWDADNTDIDLHVVEPCAEEAYYAHNRTVHGGMVSRDITDGYGPEEYLIGKAPPGEYAIFANYYGSSQQTVLGPATVTATIFTDWGRAGERQQTIAIRLETPRDSVPVGRVMFGKGDTKGSVSAHGSPSDLAVGMTVAEVDAILGQPKNVDGSQRDYDGGSDTVIKALFDSDDRLVMAARHFPGGAIMILVQ